MSRFKSTLLRAGLLASLLSFGTGAAFAEAPNADIRNGVQRRRRSTSASRW